LAAAVDRLVLTRWVAASLMVALTLFCVRVLGVPLPETELLVLAGLVVFYNAALAQHADWTEQRFEHEPERQSRRMERILLAQVGLDWVTMLAFLHLTGGISSPAIPLFLIHMLMVTVLLPSPSPYGYVLLATLALGALAVLEFQGVLQHIAVLPLPEALHRDLRYIAAQLAFFAIVAFSTVHLTRLIVARLRERDRQVAAMLRAAQAVSSSLKLDDVLKQLVDSAARALSARAAAIRLIDETGERMAMIASFGLSERYLNKGFVEMSRSQIDREALGGRPVIVGDALSDPRIQYPREVTDEGIRSMLVVPVKGRRGPLGVLRVYGAEPHEFNQDDTDFAMSVAAQGAAAIENAMTYEALQRAEATRSQFVRTVTHELRSPLSGARSVTRVMLDGMAGELPEEQRSLLTRVDARLTFLAELVNDLLALAATQAAELQDKPVTMNLVAAVRRVTDHQAPEGRAKGVDVTLDAPDGSILVRGTDQGLARIFGNLVGNAIKYTPQGGTVSVRIGVEETGGVVTVSDTGIGIPEEDLPNLWKEFYRASNARGSEIQGTGLGLSIVRRLVTGFGGLVSVSSKLGQGTIFTVGLPIVKQSAADPAEPEQSKVGGK
jgi:signal transduction histidine kinase